MLVALIAMAAGIATARATAVRGEGTPVAPVVQPDDTAPPSTLLGAAPDEAPGEIWSAGNAGPDLSIFERTDATGWVQAPGPLDLEGAPLTGFSLIPSPLAGSIAADGSGAMLGVVDQTRQALLVRNPGGTFTEVPTPSVEDELLEPGEQLFAGNLNGRPPLLATVGEAGTAGVFLVPELASSEGAALEDGVLRWHQGRWTRESIEVGEAKDFRVLAIGASSPTNAWLLGQSEGPGGTLALYQRQEIGIGSEIESSWVPEAEAESPFPAARWGGGDFTVEGMGEPPTNEGQLLTVSSDGVWVDGEVSAEGQAAQATFFQVTNPARPDRGTLTKWCDVLVAGCQEPLGVELPRGFDRSYAWGDGQSGSFGTRVITGLSAGRSLRLERPTFTTVLGLGATEGARSGSAFDSPVDGWIGEDGDPAHLTTEPEPDRLTPWPVPFRHQLTALAAEPGKPVAGLESGALAVGALGEVARYLPGSGWEAESLLGSGGKRATPTLRGVAWPEPGVAYAVGDEGQMWRWLGATGLWEHDPGTPFDFRGNLTAIAFDPSDPDRGYAVGKQGVLLGLGKSWDQEPLPAGLSEANFTDVAFAGDEALVTYRITPPGTSSVTGGGLLVNDGSGWRIDEEARTLLGEGLVMPSGVAGLPDGGAVVTSVGQSNRTIEREGVGQPWKIVPGAVGGGAVAAFREGGALRAVVSTAAPGNATEITDPGPAGSPPPFQPAYELPTRGQVMRQTASGWRDEQHESFPSTQPDQSLQPDPILAFLLDPAGETGWAVGGAGEAEHLLDTAAVMRYPGGAPPPASFSEVPVQTSPGAHATFAVGAGAGCASACAFLANDRIGPDVWLQSAVGRVNQIAANGSGGLRAFLYLGPRVAEAAAGSSAEEERYAAILGSGSGTPTFVAPTKTDETGGSTAAFQGAFLGFPAPFGSAPATGIVEVPEGRSTETGEAAQTAYYAFGSIQPGGGGQVRMIVLDWADGTIGSAQLEWLTRMLAAAKSVGEPAIVAGSADLHTLVAEGNLAAVGVANAIVGGGASAYLYDAPQENRQFTLTSGAASIPTFGTGTLGYVSQQHEELTPFHYFGSSGLLLIDVSLGERNPATNVAPVSARLVPVISRLAIEAKDGTLLRRSQPALFAALGRRPEAGRLEPTGESAQPDPYVLLPQQCLGADCATGVFPEYTFRSSEEDVGDFVVPNTSSGNAEQPLLNSQGETIPDPSSGLFCAFNAGTTTVSVESGGLAYSVPVTVQQGSVEQPCGTVPLKNPPAQEVSTAVPPPPPPPAPGPGPTPGSPTHFKPPPPPPPVHAHPIPVSHPHPVQVPHPVKPPAAHHVPTPVSPAPIQGSSVFRVPAIVPPPPPAVPQPVPPSGTSSVEVSSPVAQSAVAPEEKREIEIATEQAHHMAVYDPEGFSVPPMVPIVAIAAGLLAGCGLVGIGRRRRDYAFAHELHPPTPRRPR